MRVTIKDADRTRDGKATVTGTTFVLHFTEHDDGSGGDHEHSYTLTEQEIAGDVHAIIKREVEIGQREFLKSLSPDVTEKAVDLIATPIAVVDGVATVGK